MPRAKKMHLAKTHFAECQKMALGKIHLCRVPEKRHSAKTHFAECRKMALGKIHICRVPKQNTRQIHLCRVFFLPSVFYLALAKTVFAECPIKYTRQSLRHSAKCRFPVVPASCYQLVCGLLGQLKLKNKSPVQLWMSSGCIRCATVPS